MPRVPGVSHRYLTVDGIRFHVAQAGRGEPLVMLHGWPQNWYLWRHLVATLGRRYRLIMPDLRGFGWSDAPRDGYRKERLASDVIGILDGLGIERFRLMGHDWGGFVSYLVALREPSRVERLVVLNMIHPWPSPLGMLSNVPQSSYMMANALGVSDWLLQHRQPWFFSLIRRTLARNSAMSDADLKVFLDPLSEPSRAHATVMMYRDFMLREVLPIGLGRYRSRRLETPTLVLFGENDAAISTRLLGGFAAHADDMRVELVPDCGHFIADEKPEVVAGRALDFFARD
jgi:pimeloyl-ACP methyl ester carboxylesterase